MDHAGFSTDVNLQDVMTSEFKKFGRQYRKISKSLENSSQCYVRNK